MKLFIGNLSWNTTEEMLRKHLETVGVLSECRIVTDRETGRMRGFAFASYSSDDDSTSAVGRLNNTELDGRLILVSEARAPEPRRNNIRVYHNNNNNNNNSSSYR